MADQTQSPIAEILENQYMILFTLYSIHFAVTGGDPMNKTREILGKRLEEMVRRNPKLEDLIKPDLIIKPR